MNTLAMLLSYKQWTNELTFAKVRDLPDGEAEKPRETNFGTILHTLNHVYVVDDIFRCHLEGRAHSYAARNTETSPPLEDLWQAQQEMDAWYIDYARSLSETALDDMVEFTYVGGGQGRTTRQEILLHIVNHGTYHRGFVGDMIYQVPDRPTANDLTVFLRDHYRSADP